MSQGEGKSIPFGKNLRKIRKDLGMSGAELSRRTGLTPACINQLETGMREPTLTTIIRILRVIPISFEKLIGISDHDRN